MELPPEAWTDRLTTGAGTAVDSLLLGAMQWVVDSLMMPGPDGLPALRASAETLASPELQHDPRRFFAFDALPERPRGVKARFRRRLPGGVAVARQLTTAYEPWPHGAESPIADPAITGRLLVEHWMHDAAHRRGTVIALHGFTMGHPRVDALALFAGDWFRRGLDVALVTLPFHGARTPPEARFSGEHFAVPHVARLSEATRQAIYEVRLLVRWLREKTGDPVGLLGLSLGGYLTALYAGLYDDLDFAVPIVPPVCIGDLAWRFFLRSRHHREAGPEIGREELRTLYRVHSPLAHPLRMPRERVLIVAGRGDRIVPPEHPHALWQHWDEPGIHWFSGSHLAPFGRGRIVRRVVQLLEDADVLS